MNFGRGSICCVPETNYMFCELKPYLVLPEEGLICHWQTYCLLTSFFLLNSNAFLELFHYKDSVSLSMFTFTHWCCTYSSSSCNWHDLLDRCLVTLEGLAADETTTRNEIEYRGGKVRQYAESSVAGTEHQYIPSYRFDDTGQNEALSMLHTCAFLITDMH